jgi:hypothetical protein
MGPTCQPHIFFPSLFLFHFFLSALVIRMPCFLVCFVSFGLFQSWKTISLHLSIITTDMYNKAMGNILRLL